MTNSEPLVAFGIAVIIFCGLLILIPFLRKKSELLTAWNVLLLGIMLFTGLGSIEVRYVDTFAWKSLNWFQPSVQEVRWYMAAITAFIAALVLAYYYNGPAKRFAERRLRTWPNEGPPTTFLVLVSCAAILVFSFAVRNAVFIGPIFANFAQCAAVLACVFTYAPWSRNRFNVLSLGMFAGVFVTAAIYAMLASGGRRLLMSMFLAPMVCEYWFHIRYWRPMKTLGVMGVAAIFMLGVTTVYSSFRWYNLAGREKRTVSGLVKQLENTRTTEGFLATLLAARIDYFTQQNGHFSLLAERYVSEGIMPAVPLNTLRFLLAFPIPRKIWPDKPEVVGIVIVRDASGIIGTNWGVGIAGHGAYEGGIPALILYGALFALLVRFIDEPLQLQPTNPFLIGIHAAALPQVLAIPRGDFGIFTISILIPVLLCFLLGTACRILFGTQQNLTSPVSARATYS